MAKMDSDKYQLKVENCGDMVKISIGAELLIHAVLHGPAFGDDPDLKVTDKKQFFLEIVKCLQSEEEDGTTLLHRAFDKAAIDAVENGCEGIECD